MKAFTFAKSFFNKNYVSLLGKTTLVASFAYAATKYNVFNSIDFANEEFAKRLSDNLHNRPPANEFYHNVTIFSGNANLPLANEICQQLGTSLGKIHVGRFGDGEVNIQIQENVRGKDPTCNPVNENLIELLLMVSTLRRASAGRITVIIPYYGYSRQDRKVQPRVPISAADVARLLETMGVDRVVGVDLHCGQIQGFFGPRVPVDNLEANIVGLTYVKEHSQEIDLDNLTIVSPDAGGVTRANKFCDMLKNEGYNNVSLAMIIKRREKPSQISSMYMVGSVENQDVVIVDDMIDTAGTLCKAADELKKNGAKKVYAFAIHGIFSGKSFENIQKSQIEKIIVTNTIPVRQGEENCSKIIRLSVGPLLAEAIRRIQEKESVSNLFLVRR